MSKGKVDKLMDRMHELIESISDEKLTLSQYQDLLRAAIVEIGTQIAVKFQRDAAAQGHQGPGPHYWDTVLDLGSYALSLKDAKQKQ